MSFPESFEGFDKQLENPAGFGDAVFFGKKDGISRDFGSHFSDSRLLNFSNLRAELMKVPTNSQDTIFLCGIMNDVYGDSRMPAYFAEVRRILKDGGRAFVFDEGDFNMSFLTDIGLSMSQFERHSIQDGNYAITSFNTDHVGGVEIAKLGKIDRTILNEQAYTTESRSIISDVMRKVLTPKDGQGTFSYDVMSSDDLEKMTEWMCHPFSKRVLSYLTRDYPNRFDRLFWFGDGVDTDHRYGKNWKSHSCFCARELTGKWFAGSPANYTQGESFEEMIKLEEGETVSQVLRAHFRRFGRELPASDLESINTMDYIHPILHSTKNTAIENGKDPEMAVFTSYGTSRQLDVVGAAIYSRGNDSQDMGIGLVKVLVPFHEEL